MSYGCNHCQNLKKNPVTTCIDCDREYLLIDVRYYRAARKFKLVRKIPHLEPSASQFLRVRRIARRRG